jgi:hypothetical protein
MWISIKKDESKMSFKILVNLATIDLATLTFAATPTLFGD